ncbi:conserved membrane hypothetical protein [uncultured Eubacteriales bacterium]|uniref:ABC transmembrane type-1 domain-containing protein n=1 Tax=uncultured Eubacteriales bacterium TaxID=172733 RepID=A0A212KEY9_9FIRM|nr:conserved membrane hypothetical protein [uncultured Eubacteriales bacterium]
MGNSNRNKILKVVAPLAFWLGVWQLAALFVGKELLLPGPVAVGEQLLHMAGTSAFWQSAALSLGRVLAGFLAGAGTGAVLAVLTAAFSWADLLFSPAVRVVRAIPVVSFILLIMLWLSTGMVPGVCAGLMVMPVVWGNVRKGIGETDPLLLESAKAYRFTPLKTARLVYLPSVLPYFASSCVTGLGLAWKAGVAAEVISQPKRAIGLEMHNSKLYLETPSLFAWTVVVIALSFVLENLLSAFFLRMERGRRG